MRKWKIIQECEQQKYLRLAKNESIMEMDYKREDLEFRKQNWLEKNNNEELVVIFMKKLEDFRCEVQMDSHWSHRRKLINLLKSNGVIQLTSNIYVWRVHII